MQTAPRTVVTSDGASLYAEISGDPNAPVTLVLAHGWTLTSSSWAAQIAALGSHARVISYDQRGHGRSSRGAARLSIRLLGYDLATVIDQLAPDGPLVLAGHSMGGMTLMALAAVRPELFGTRVRGVALVDTAAGELRHSRLGVRRFGGITSVVVSLGMWIMAHLPALAEPVRRQLVPDRAATLRSNRWLLFGPDAPRAPVAACGTMMSATPTRMIGAFYFALGEHDEYPTLPVLGKARAHVLVGALDRLTPVPLARRLAAGIPGARLTVTPRAGHMLMMEKPDVVTAALCELIAAAPDTAEAASDAGEPAGGGGEPAPGAVAGESGTGVSDRASEGA